MPTEPWEMELVTAKRDCIAATVKRLEAATQDLCALIKQTGRLGVDAVKAEAAEKTARVRAETNAIVARGGDSKALGSNETDRTRALAAALIENADYQVIRDLDAKSSEAYHLSKSDAEAAQAEVDALTAILSAYAS